MKQAAALLACLVASAPAASRAEPPAGKRWAVVVGVKEYNDGLFRRLEYSTNDARLIHRLLTTRCQFPAQQVALMVDEAGDSRLLPFQRQIVAEVSRVAGLAREADTVLVFFSGHGVPDGAGGVVLASRDCDKKRPAQTGIPVTWLREVLEKCPARQKLLVLDCCHAGAGRGAAETTRLAPCFEQAQGLVTMAGCGPDELSREWPRVEQGLFTHFLRCGLEGAADLDGNGVVDVEELYKFVYNEVSATALKELNTGQHPQIYRGPDTSGVIALAQLDRPDSPYPIHRNRGESYQRELVYTERFLIQRPDRAPITAEYSETHRQQVEVQQVDASSRPTHLTLRYLGHKKKTQGQLPGRTRFCQIRGPLQGKTIAHELRPRAAIAFLIDDPGAKPLPHLPHPLLVDECLLPDMALKIGESTTDPGRLQSLLESLLPEARIHPESPPRITLESTLEGGSVLVFKGQARGTACVSTPTPANFDVHWTAEYVPREMRIRHARFEAESSRVRRGNQEMNLSITCEIDVRAGGDRPR